MLLRAITAFVALPGLVAFALPIEIGISWHPGRRPRHLVTTGPYHFSRNPMYIGVLTILVGWCVLSESRPLLNYTLVVAGFFYPRVLVVEEPWAARSFGAEWDAYRASVSRWIGTPSPLA